MHAGKLLRNKTIKGNDEMYIILGVYLVVSLVVLIKCYINAKVL